MNAHFLNENGLSVSLPDNFTAMVSAVSDLAVITDRRGKILDIVWNLETPGGFDPRSLIGTAMADIVTTECRSKIAEMLRVDETGEGGRQREINHDLDGMDQFPVRYSAVGSGETVVFIGHEIRAIAALQTRLVEAQRALDEDYGRLRQLETQYRVLFQTSSEALLLIDAESGRIEDVNAAAADILSGDAQDLKRQQFEDLFAQSEVATIREALHTVNTSGQADDFQANLLQSKYRVVCNLSVFRAAQVTMVLCTIVPGDQATDGPGGIEDQLMGLLSRIPDAVVLTDDEGRISWCNDAFLGMAEIALMPQAEGEPLARFLGRPGVDMDIITANAREHGRLRAFSSVLTGAYGSETRVEISVAALADHKSIIGFVMRDISRYDQIPARKPELDQKASSDLMNLVGAVPLKELVRASTEEIEKMCIETALKKTGNNRASAAEMLGLSRQSLYVKLRRFGLLDKDG